MTQSNSKLTREQKNDRIEWLTAMDYSGGDVAGYGSFTVAKMPDFKGSKMAQFSVSVCSDTEKKFRRKVGEYHALRRLFDCTGEWITLPNSIDAFGLAYDLSCRIGE